MKLLDEEMDGVAREQRERLESIEEELEDVKRKLGRIWHVIETTDIEMADASDRIREHRERKEKLEVAAEEARTLLADRRVMLDSADVIATFAEEMSEFLKTSELTETRSFVHSFVKEVEVKPGKAAIVYSIPTPEDSPVGGASAAEVALNGGVRSSVRHGGPSIQNYRRFVDRGLAHDYASGNRRTWLIERDRTHGRGSSEVCENDAETVGNPWGVRDAGRHRRCLRKLANCHPESWPTG